MTDWRVESAWRPAVAEACARSEGSHRALRAPTGPSTAVPIGDLRASAQAVVESFNTWAFKREQPDNPALMTRRAEEAIEASTPLAFVLYWGKGPRAEYASADAQCLDFLGTLARRVRGRHRPGAELTIICTDTHAALNGHSPIATRRYFAAIGEAAAERGFRTCLLSDLVAWAVDRLDRARALDPPHPELMRALTASAAKWYRGGRSPEEGARLYYEANMIEKQAVEAAFARAVFITFNGSDLRPLFPDGMPIFYMYSIRRGVAIKPWFMEAEPEAPRTTLEAVQ